VGSSTTPINILSEVEFSSALFNGDVLEGLAAGLEGFRVANRVIHGE